MRNRIAELKCREVINIADGARLGFPADVVIEIPCGQVCALVVPGPCRFFGLFGREFDYLIPWEAIRRIGEDTILVEIDPAAVRTRRGKEKKFRDFAPK